MGAGAATQDTFTTAVICAWNLMGGEIRWEALPAIAELLGVENMELLIVALAQVRDHLQTVAKKTAEVKAKTED
jgi:hypothetical protein